MVWVAHRIKGGLENQVEKEKVVKAYPEGWKILVGLIVEKI